MQRHKLYCAAVFIVGNAIDNMTMEICHSIEEIRKIVNRFKAEGKSVGFVPTMGAIHEGHLSLVRIAREISDAVVVSIYVNPEQFAPDEDFEKYPRQFEKDRARLQNESVDVIFSPNDEMIYPGEKYLKIEIDKLNEYMDGASRPGFFEGIILVVNKLFNIVGPDVAVFGQKDVQQFRILQQMVREMNHPVNLVMGPIIRANDGLALSSRNAYLDDERRTIAPGLFRSLKFIEKKVLEGITNHNLLIEHQKDELEAKGFKIDYLDLFSFDALAPVDRLKSDVKYIIAGAVYLGETRLIDNIIVEL